MENCREINWWECVRLLFVVEQASQFSKGHAEIWYNEFCDILSTHWTPNATESTDKIDQLEQLLIDKLRDDNSALRKVFRKHV